MSLFWSVTCGVLLAATALAVVGCGDDDGDEVYQAFMSTSPPDVAVTPYAAEAHEPCPESPYNITLGDLCIKLPGRTGAGEALRIEVSLGPELDLEYMVSADEAYFWPPAPDGSPRLRICDYGGSVHVAVFRVYPDGEELESAGGAANQECAEMPTVDHPTPTPIPGTAFRSCPSASEPLVVTNGVLCVNLPAGDSGDARRVDVKFTEEMQFEYRVDASESSFWPPAQDGSPLPLCEYGTSVRVTVFDLSEDGEQEIASDGLAYSC